MEMMKHYCVIEKFNWLFWKFNIPSLVLRDERGEEKGKVFPLNFPSERAK